MHFVASLTYYTAFKGIKTSDYDTDDIHKQSLDCILARVSLKGKMETKKQTTKSNN